MEGKGTRVGGASTLRKKRKTFIFLLSFTPPVISPPATFYSFPLPQASEREREPSLHVNKHQTFCKKKKLRFLSLLKETKRKTRCFFLTFFSLAGDDERMSSQVRHGPRRRRRSPLAIISSHDECAALHRLEGCNGPMTVLLLHANGFCGLM